MPSVAILTPSRTDMVHADYCLSLAEAMVYTWHKRVPCSIANIRGCYIGHMRNMLVEGALEQGVSHLMWLDSDMMFPPDTICRLLEHDKDIVCAAYRSRARERGRNVFFVDEEGDLRRVTIVGMGVMLVKADVYRKLPKPWYWVKYGDAKVHDIETLGLQSEDTNFYALARHYAGSEVWCDMKLTEEIAHLGMEEIRWG